MIFPKIKTLSQKMAVKKGFFINVLKIFLNKLFIPKKFKLLKKKQVAINLPDMSTASTELKG